MGIGEKLNTVSAHYNYCSICSLKLIKYDLGDDLWCMGYKCNNHHSWYSRNGISREGCRDRIDLDITEEWMAELMKSYILNKKRSKDLPVEIINLFR